MRFTIAIATTLLTVFGTAALAEEDTGPGIYAFASKHNFCPEGLQPVTADGTICCGVPNQEITYQQLLAHASTKRRHARANCPVGTKGCTFD